MYQVVRDGYLLYVYGDLGQELGEIYLTQEPWTGTLINAVMFCRAAFEREFGELTNELEDAIYNSVVQHWLTDELGTETQERQDVWEEVIRSNYGHAYDEWEEEVSELFKSIISKIDLKKLGTETQRRQIVEDLERLWLDHYSNEIERDGNYKYQPIKLTGFSTRECGRDALKWEKIRLFFDSVAQGMNTPRFWDERRAGNYEKD